MTILIPSIRKTFNLLLKFVATIAFCWMVSLNLSADDKETLIKLTDHCPPYFNINQQNQCMLNSLYDLYPEVNQQWGGYRVALPNRRDGFTPQQIDLGRYLFFDSVISADKDLSCAHCHHPDFALSDGRSRSIGRHGKGIGPSRSGAKELARGAPMLWNLTFQKDFFWDSRVSSLEQQIEAVFATPTEMAINPEQIIANLNAIPTYQKLFFEAFGSATIKFENVLTAIVAFETSLISLNSPYDRYIHGDHNALTAQELNGLHIFRSFASRCSQCHTPPLFTSGQVTTTGVPAAKGLAYDVGAEAITGESSLRGAFKVPSLRNIARSAPFMHSGQFNTLSEVVNFYNNEPGHAVSEQIDLTLHWHIVNPRLKADEISDLVAFMGALTDETAIPKVPKNVPSRLAVP